MKGVKKEHFHLGMRIFKTGVSILLITLLYDNVIHSNPQIAALSAVYTQRRDFSETWHLGFMRIFSNTVGGLMAIPLIFAESQFLNLHFLHYLFPMIGTMLTIKACQIGHAGKATVGGVAVFLIIYFSIPVHNRYQYIIFRVLDTFIGAMVATFVEWAMPRSRWEQWRHKTHQLLKNYLHKNKSS